MTIILSLIIIILLLACAVMLWSLCGAHLQHGVLQDALREEFDAFTQSAERRLAKLEGKIDGGSKPA